MMKYLLLLLMGLLPFTVCSQDNAGELYDEMCDPLQAVFCDYVAEESEMKIISNKQGTFLGTFIDNAIYGWGYYKSSSGSQSFGQYRKGELIFGLIISNGIAKVGGKDNYVVYDLCTGEITRLHTMEGDVKLSYPYVASADGKSSPYSFRKESCENGDIFYGEFYNGKRHGYGVCCLENGDIWYGRYKEGYRDGYGMLIKPGKIIHYGKWSGDTKVE